MGEPSHTYIGFTPHPKSNASRILSDFKDEDEIWKSLYREYLKPPREHLLGKDKKEKEKEKGKEKEKEKGKEKGKEKEKGLTERLASTVADFLARPTSEPKEKKETKKKIISKPTDSHHLVITRWNENLTWVKDYFGRHGHAIDGVTVMQKVNDDLKDSLISRKMEKGSFSYLDLHLSTPLKDPPNFDQFLPAFGLLFFIFYFLFFIFYFLFFIFYFLFFIFIFYFLFFIFYFYFIFIYLFIF